MQCWNAMWNVFLECVFGNKFGMQFHNAILQIWNAILDCNFGMQFCNAFCNAFSNAIVTQFEMQL